MALVTVSRSPSGSGHSTPVGPADEGLSRRSQLQRRQSFAVLRGAVLGLQDRGEPSAGGQDRPDEEDDPEEKVPPSDHPDGSGRGTPECPSPGKQEQRRHLHLMVGLLRAQDNIQLAVQLETTRPQWLRYLLVVSTSELLSQDETVLLGVDFSQSSPPSCTLGLVLPLWSDTQVYLDGDGGFTVTSGGQTRIFKPISIQTMWATLQVLHQACEMALGNGLVPGGSALAWAGHYQDRISSDQSCINEWTAMADLESLRAQLPSADSGGHSEQERMERLIRAELGDVLDTSDLESVTSKEIRLALEGRLGCPLQQHRDFIDNQMLVLMAQRDRASLIFPHLYLGSEWNAANLDELQRNRVSHILNVAREIDNFYPELFTYHNVRLWDEETEQLLPHWKETHGFIEAARAQGSRVLVHCKMGVSRSAATVMAYAMKQYNWGLEQALRHVQELRPVARPNPGFLRQLHTYQGILTASRQSHVWEQKAGGRSSLEQPREASWSPPEPSPEPGAGGRGEPGPGPGGPRPRMDLRGIMRSISLLEPPDLGSHPETSDLPEVFSSSPCESSDGALCRASADPADPRPALLSRKSVAALHGAALVASRSPAFEAPGQGAPEEVPKPRLGGS
ncbi:protein phosphatase Slingshot homolog 3 [Monodelphis domestica]|uniref:protein phosphatase Slingshot homolog 3 n=1 Tax=Monodelphis domestica TaxID=13616 RepID=UPI0024E1BA8A|nr:protein phosphatase Slingshot homolog 3 [Monodelphis domestica]